MEDFGDEWNEFAERLAREPAPALKRSLYRVHLDRIRMMRAPSEKLSRCQKMWLIHKLTTYQLLEPYIPIHFANKNV